MVQPIKKIKTLKRMTLFLAALIFIPTFGAQANRDRASRLGRGGARSGSFNMFGSRSPVVINMRNGFSGGDNRNFPSQNSRAGSPGWLNRQPSYGRFHWSSPERNWLQPRAWTPAASKSEWWTNGVNPRPDLKSYSGPGIRPAVAIHHQAYTQGYVRNKLKKIGVTREPNLITDRSEIIHTDRQHSSPPAPRGGLDQRPLLATSISDRHFNGSNVRQQMSRLEGADWKGRINRFNSMETRRDHYYWHRENGFDSCHYIDSWGYDWWGWYMGDQFFWTRYYGGRWWFYDPGFDRWCFWNDGYWWWQDPYHVGDLYCYNDDNYIPCNSADDQVVVTGSLDSNLQVYKSPDGTREVKIMGDNKDAFLYDTANPPTFDPVYLASGEQEVEFSNPSKGKPLEIILKLNDGTFDMFDDYGNPYNPSDSDDNQNAQEETGGNNQG